MGITQTLSQKILQPPPSDDPAQQQTQQILKFLPFMIGWFALNVPAGLGVYWVFNNAITTAQGWYIRQQFKPAGATTGSTGSAAAAAPSMFSSSSSSATIEKPKAAAKAAPSGFVVDDRLPKLEKIDTEVSEASEDDDEEEGGSKTLSKNAEKKKAKALS